jgi:hypothetical protein
LEIEPTDFHIPSAATTTIYASEQNKAKAKEPSSERLQPNLQAHPSIGKDFRHKPKPGQAEISSEFWRSFKGADIRGE